MRIKPTLALVTAFIVAAPIVSAEGFRRGRMMPPPRESEIDESEHSSASSKPDFGGRFELPGKGDGVKEYCKMVHVALQKGMSITPDSGSAERFNASIDFLTKADALCAAIAPVSGKGVPPVRKLPKGGSSSSGVASSNS